MRKCLFSIGNCFAFSIKENIDVQRASVLPFQLKNYPRYSNIILSVSDRIGKCQIQKGILMNAQKRIVYLDMAKGVGIVLMIAGHLIGSLQSIDNKSWFSGVYQFIASFHMPLFFIISGILLWITKEEEREYGLIVCRKAKALLIPYLTFSLIYFVINVCTCILHPELLAFSDLWKFFIYSITFRGVSVLWFLPTLFFGEILFLWCRKRLDDVCLTGLFAVTGFLMLFLSPVFGQEVWEGSLGMMALGAVLQTMARSLLSCTLLLIGYWAAHVIGTGEKKSIPGFLVGAVMLVACGILCFQNGSVDLNYMVFDHFLLYMGNACLGSFGVILICKNMFCSRLLLFFGVNSLVIMATHMEFKVMLHTIQFSYWLNRYVTRAKELVLFVTMAVLITVMEAGIVFVYNHYLYFLIGKKRPVK